MTYSSAACAAGILRRAAAVSVAISVAGVLISGTAALAAPGHRAAAPAAAGGVQTTTPYRLPQVVAMVNGTPITRNELDGELERGPQAQQALFSLILSKLLHAEAIKEGLEPTKAQIEQSFNDANVQTQGRLPMLLERDHLTRATFEDQILRPRLEMEAISHKGVVVSDADVLNYFQEHKEQWAIPEQVKMYRLHVPTLDVAKQAQADLEKGTAWDAVLKKYSDDKPYYKEHLGYYGTVPRNLLPQNVQDAIKNLKPGGVSAPIQMPEEGANSGYVLWRLAEVVPAKQPSLDDHKKEIRSLLLSGKAKPTIEIVQQLVKGAKIADLPPGFETMFQSVLSAQPPPPRPGTGGGFQPPAPPPGLNGGRRPPGSPPIAPPPGTVPPGPPPTPGTGGAVAPPPPGS